MTDLDSTTRPWRPASAVLQLVSASFVVLFQELAFIRWVPAQVRVLAYFPNVVLLSAFLGLGIGCLLRARRSLLWLWPLAVLLVVTVSVALSRIAFTAESTSEHLWLLYLDLPKTAPVVDGVRLPIVVLFILSALSFVSLGQVVARALHQFQHNSTSLKGYASDLLGSLLGIIAFSALSFLGTFPVVWFAVALAAGIPLVRHARRAIVSLIICSAAILGVVHFNERALVYSPYYALQLVNSPPEVMILANGSLHQVAGPMNRADDMRADRSLMQVREGYHRPYMALGRKPRHVLVLGAGSGNDVAVALDNGAERVDAVEIDPYILRIGRDLHPNRPYSSPKVRVFNTDARAFLNNTTEKYDLIVFGTLDSMTRLSALSNVRLDNFVYTVECMRAAARHLTPDGGMILYFMSAADYIADHIFGMLTEATGRTPLTIEKYYWRFNIIFMTGPAFDHLRPVAQAEAPADLGIEVPTDDWPYLYLNGRGVSGFYLSMIAIFAAISVVSVLASSREMRAGLGSGRVDLEMLLFGAAFLLLETKLVTQMSLVWGATWLTSAVVFASILVMLLFGTLLTQWKPVPWAVASTGLIVSLVVTWLFSPDTLVGTSIPVRLAGSILYAGTPIFFASLCFAERFSKRENSGLAFGWNMLGAVLGGLLEFLSMAVGLRALTLLALSAYLLAFLIRGRTASRQPAES